MILTTSYIDDYVSARFDTYNWLDLLEIDKKRYIQKATDRIFDNYTFRLANLDNESVFESQSDVLKDDFKKAITLTTLYIIANENSELEYMRDNGVSSLNDGGGVDISLSLNRQRYLLPREALRKLSKYFYPITLRTR